MTIRWVEASLVVALLTLCPVAESATFQIFEARLFLHDSSGTLLSLDESDPLFFGSLSATGDGEVGWSVTNNGPTAWTDLRLTVYMDGEFDDDPLSDLDFANETGEFLGLPTPPAPGVDPVSWEIDDPFFGDIFQNVLLGNLDNANELAPSGSDVALAFGFILPFLNPGDQVAATIIGDLAATTGIRHRDLASGDEQIFNSRLVVTRGDPNTPVPEPGTGVLVTVGIVLLARSRTKAAG